MCQLQVHCRRFQVKLHELYRFMILFVYIVPFFFSKTAKNQPKSPAYQRKPPTVSDMCPFQVYWHWFRAKFVQIDRFMILFVHLLIALFSLKTLRNYQKPWKIKENLQLFLICVDFKLTCTGSISYMTDSIDFMYQLFIWSHVTPRKPPNTSQDHHRWRENLNWFRRASIAN